MTRRSLAAVLVAVALLPATSHAADPPPKPEMPRVPCAKRFADPTGDGYSNPTSTPAFNVQKTPGLDIVGAYLRTTADQVQVFLEIDDIPVPTAMPAYDLAYRYNVSFKIGTVAFNFAHIHKNPNTAAAFGGKIYPDSLPVMSGLTGEVDPATDFVYVTAPLATVEQKATVPLTEGTKIEAVAAKTEYLMSSTHSAVGDELKPAADAAVWFTGDDYCFGPPPGALSDVTATAVQYGDTATLRAKLVDEAGAAVAGQQLRFTVAGAAPVVGTTDTAGVATVKYVAALTAGTKAVTVEFAGNEAVGKASAAGSLVVRPETTKFAALKVAKPSTTSRVVTATLRDDDGKAVAAQKVAWYVNGKKVATVTTNKAGQSVYRGAKRGQSVQARFVAVAGKYLAASSKTAKV